MRQGASPGALLHTALQHHQAGRLGDAERHYQQILQIDPGHANALHFWGVLAHQTQRLTLAAELINKAIAIDSNAPVFHNNLGNVFHAQGRLLEAAASYERALCLKPDYAGAHFNLGIVLQAQDHLARAAAAYQKAIDCRPDYAEAHCNLGNVLQAQGLLNEGLEAYRRALACRPNYAHAYGNMANVLKALGRREEALNAYREALRLQSDYLEAHNNRAILLLELDRLDDAAGACRIALEHHPDSAETHTIHGNILREQGRLSECLAAYGRALALAPHSAEARLASAVAVIPIYVRQCADNTRSVGDFEHAVNELTGWHTRHPGMLGRAVGTSQPFYLAYKPGNLCAPLSAYGDLICSAVSGSALTNPRFPTAGARHERLRLAIVCGQVREHPVWHMILSGIVAHRDRERIELMIYHTGSLVDDKTRWAANQADHFSQGPKPTGAWLAEIAGAAPDVIFYPEVGMDPAACALAAHRLAERQIASWGHPVTTGLPTIDRFMSGALLEPEDAESHYREQLVRLPGTGVCTESPDVEPRHWRGPARAPNVVRFALCQQPIKFDPADDVLLARIAKAAGPSEFWLVAPQRHAWATTLLLERLQGAFQAEGVHSNVQVRVVSWMTRAQFSGFLDAMDIYLDCPAFSGYTTAWQASHRGLPVVTWEGRFLRQRLAAGLLRQMGDTEGICASGAQYVDVATRWAAECRDQASWAARRAAVAAAAANADHNFAAVHAFQQSLLGA